MTRSARLVLTATLPAAILWLLCAPRLSAEEYRFPITNPLKSSLLPAGYPPPRVRYAMSFLEIRSDRRQVRFFENRHRLILAVFAQRTPAPLVFVVPGVGGYSLSEPALMLGEQLHGMGFHAVTLPDPLSWQYTLGVSESAVPGYLPLDAREYYDFLRRVVSHLQADQQLAVTGYSVVGYSFRGLLTAFLVREDAEQRAFAFTRAVLIDPAIDIKHAVGVVDGFFDAGHSISDARKDEISRAMVDVVMRLRNRPFTYELAGWATFSRTSTTSSCARRTSTPCALGWATGCIFTFAADTSGISGWTGIRTTCAASWPRRLTLADPRRADDTEPRGEGPSPPLT
jgi:hypothetical protein